MKIPGIRIWLGFQKALKCWQKTCTYHRHYLRNCLEEEWRMPHGIYHAKESHLLDMQRAWEKHYKRTGSHDGFKLAFAVDRLEQELHI